MSVLITIIQLLVLWVVVALAAGLVALVLWTRRVERDQGLRRSPWRLLAAVGVFGLVFAFAAWGTVSAFTGGSRPATAERPATQGGKGTDTTSSPQAGPTQDELDRLEKERKELEEKLAQLRKRIEAARPAAAPQSKTDESAKPAEDPAAANGAIEVPVVLIVITVVVLIAGAVALFLLGDPEVLLRLFRKGRSELRLKAMANLDRLTAAADRGQFRDGITHADATDAHLLDRFERLDWLFLRAYCAVQLANAEGVSDAESRPLLERAVRELTTLLEEAPNRTEAAYLLATAQGCLGQYAPALEGFTAAEKSRDAGELPFAHNRSVCLLKLAEEALGKGDVTESGRLFDQVTRLKVLAERIPSTHVRVRLLTVRRNLQAGQLAEAAEGIETVRKLEGLDVEQRRNVEVVCDALQTLVSVRRGDDAMVLQQIDAFLTRHMPDNLPPPDERIADEYLEPPITGVTLRLAPQVFGAFLFLKAAALARAAKTGSALTVAQVGEIARPLLTALQFELRERNALAALGGLYYWFVPEKRRKAVSWLEAAVAMGVDSRIARRLLDRDRRIEAENQEALDWFRSAAGRFLHDPTVSQHVRQALVEELGRFQGFQPLLLDRETDLDPQEPTLRLLRDRAGYLQQMVFDFAARKPAAVRDEFDRLSREYAQLIAGLDSSSGRMAEIERRLVQEIGKTVLS